jgi:hypothetical protein
MIARPSVPDGSGDSRGNAEDEINNDNVHRHEEKMKSVKHMHDTDCVGVT